MKNTGEKKYPKLPFGMKPNTSGLKPQKNLECVDQEE